MCLFICSISIEPPLPLPRASDLYPLGFSAEGGHGLAQGDSCLQKWSYHVISHVGDTLEPGEEGEKEASKRHCEGVITGKGMGGTWHFLFYCCQRSERAKSRLHVGDTEDKPSMANRLQIMKEYSRPCHGSGALYLYVYTQKMLQGFKWGRSIRFPLQKERGWDWRQRDPLVITARVSAHLVLKSTLWCGNITNEETEIRRRNCP